MSRTWAVCSRRTRTIIERQVTNLSRLIDDLLEVSRVTRGKIQLRRSNVDVWDILSHVAEARSRLAAEKGLTLRVHPLEGDSLYVYADPTRLEQMIDNVLSNAVKFTPPGGNIQLRLAREADEAVIRVRDSGIGIPAEMLSSVFELFTQTKHTLARTEGGLGIGLTVVKTLALLHDGSVAAVSEGEGKGTQIVIRLPVLSKLAGQSGIMEDGASVSPSPSVSDRPLSEGP